jgi:hypothetical protein
MANRRGTGGMKKLTYSDAISTVNYRTGDSNSNNQFLPQGRGVSYTDLSMVNVWVGLDFWTRLGGRVTQGKTTVVQYVGPIIGATLSDVGSHTKRYRWNFDSFASQYAFSGASALSDETGTGTPGFYSYAAAGYNLTTFDNDQDIYGSNCSTLYNDNPWWYSNCWSGNYFAGGGYQDASYWVGSSSDYHEYGAVYIK